MQNPDSMQTYITMENSQLKELEQRREFLASVVNVSNEVVPPLNLYGQRDNLFPEFQFLDSSVPTLLPQGSFSNRLGTSRISLSDHANTCFSKDNILLRKILDNINEHAKIKDIYFRIVNSQVYSFGLLVAIFMPTIFKIV